MGRPKSVFTTEKIDQTGGLVSKPNVVETMWNNLQYNLVPQASAQPDTVITKADTENPITTSFTPTEQQQGILYAMKKQVEAEQANLVNVSPSMKVFDDGIEVTLNLQAQIDKQKATQQEQAQKALDFKNRTTEQALSEFIETQLEAERTQDTGTNFTQYVSELSEQQLNQMNTNPQAILYPSALDTVEELEAAGVAPRIIEKMLEGKAASSVQTVQQESTPPTSSVVYDTGLSPTNNLPDVNYTGQGSVDSATQAAILERQYQDQMQILYQGNSNIVYNPLEAQNQNDVVTTQAVTQVNFNGSGSETHQAPRTSVHEVVTTEKAGLTKMFHDNPLLIAGIGIIALGM